MPLMCLEDCHIRHWGSVHGCYRLQSIQHGGYLEQCNISVLQNKSMTGLTRHSDMVYSQATLMTLINPGCWSRILPNANHPDYGDIWETIQYGFTAIISDL